ncbi:NAD(P)-dependent oxidoreductase [Methyloligella sp. 2.7D]|uniref:NAD(P)-dependent oxidoreductase n=1 Tax=unclassified Methyloligella TaxID=2625955 RepID=UPI00157BFA2B|nr:NAD(P)-dependent oxidoreductase [Methyloligella sp. GL2]QKP77620.1 NAD(P)-dependent oxidoreductase [Methyloligella sp. GL2]
MKIGFVGLGAMGSAMAPHLLSLASPLSVHNRTKAKADFLIAQGAEFAPTPGDAARGDIVVSMLSNDAAVEAVVFGEDGILAALPQGALHISMSTISMALAEKLAEAHKAAGQQYLSAPVFGRPDAAAAAKLFVVAAGPEDALAKAQPVFDALGQRTFPYGAEAEKANLVKLSGNFLITAVIQSLSEAITLASKAGIDKRQYLDMLTETLFTAPVYKTYGNMIIEGRYEPPGFTATLGRKDLGLVLDAAESLQVPMSTASLIADRFLTLMATGDGDLDWAALGLLVARNAGEAPASGGQ